LRLYGTGALKRYYGLKILSKKFMLLIINGMYEQILNFPIRILSLYKNKILLFSALPSLKPDLSASYFIDSINFH
jgi:hypothetical protein